jgi:hypothetical protein
MASRFESSSGYAGRHLTAPPSIGKSLMLKLDPQTMQFGEVEQNVEGEADPSVMKLDMKVWTWISAHYTDGRETTAGISARSR